MHINHAAELPNPIDHANNRYCRRFFPRSLTKSIGIEGRAGVEDGLKCGNELNYEEWGGYRYGRIWWHEYERIWWHEYQIDGCDGTGNWPVEYSSVQSSVVFLAISSWGNSMSGLVTNGSVIFHLNTRSWVVWDTGKQKKKPESVVRSRSSTDDYQLEKKPSS